MNCPGHTPTCTTLWGGFQPKPSQDLTEIGIVGFQLPLAVKGPCPCSKAGQGDGGIRCSSGYFEVSHGGVTCPDKKVSRATQEGW